MGGIEKCFKNSNLCDKHPVCDKGEHTEGVALDESDCFEKYKKKGLIPKDATQRCQSIHHNEVSVAANLSLGIVMIEAVPCDGNPTCWKKADELLCDNDLLTIWGPGGNLYSSFVRARPFLIALSETFKILSKVVLLAPQSGAMAEVC